jgi:hypothetical protein
MREIRCLVRHAPQDKVHAADGKCHGPPEPWLVADFPLEPDQLASLADQAVARLTRDPKP